MRRKFFVVAVVFLAIALIVPPFLLFALSDRDLDNILNKGVDLKDYTQQQAVIQDIDADRTELFVLVAVVEVVSVLLFAVFLWLALKPL